MLFHTRRRFCASLSVRVSNSYHSLKYGIMFLTNKPGHKIYQCMPARSTRHYTVLHNLTIIHAKKYFASLCHPHEKILSQGKLSQSSLIHPRSPHTSSSTSKYYSNTNSSRNISFFSYLGLDLGLGLQSNQPLAHSRYISLHATT